MILAYHLHRIAQVFFERIEQSRIEKCTHCGVMSIGVVAALL